MLLSLFSKATGCEWLLIFASGHDLDSQWWCWTLAFDEKLLHMSLVFSGPYGWHGPHSSCMTLPSCEEEGATHYTAGCCFRPPSWWVGCLPQDLRHLLCWIKTLTWGFGWKPDGSYIATSSDSEMNFKWSNFNLWGEVNTFSSSLLGRPRSVCVILSSRALQMEVSASLLDPSGLSDSVRWLGP